MIKVIPIIAFTLFHYTCADKDGVPVFVIEDQGVTSHWNFHADPFKKIGISHFADVVSESTKQSACVIVFIEEQLKTEDISLKDVLGTPYINLRKGLNENKVKYLPSVSQPYKILTNLFPPRKSYIFYLDDADKFVLPNKYFKYFFVSFQDAINETRIESLRNHDATIQQVIKKVKEVKTGPVIAFYTGKRNPITIEDIDFNKKYLRSGSDDTIRSKIALFRLSGTYSATQQQLRRFDRFTQKPFAVEEYSTKTGYSTIMDYTDFQLRFVFRFTDSDWTLDKIELIESNQTVGGLSMNIGARWGCSYICASPLVILNTRDGSSLIIPKYQIQPFQALRTYREDDDGEGGGESGGEGGGGEGDGEGPSNFDKGVNCEPYFNSQILAGLFVSVICLTILTFGIVCLLDCKTNNRYDDPNGKEIMAKADMVVQG